LVFLTATLNQTSAALNAPMSWIYLCLPLSGVMMMIYALDALVTGPQHEQGA